MSDPSVSTGVLEELFKGLCAIAVAVAAFLFKDVHKKIDENKAAAAAALVAHDAAVKLDMDVVNAELERRRQIEAKLFDEISRAERDRGVRYQELTDNMHKMHTDIIDRIDRAVAAVRNEGSRT